MRPKPCINNNHHPLGAAGFTIPTEDIQTHIFDTHLITHKSGLAEGEVYYPNCGAKSCDIQYAWEFERMRNTCGNHAN